MRSYRSRMSITICFDRITLKKGLKTTFEQKLSFTYEWETRGRNGGIAC